MKSTEGQRASIPRWALLLFAVAMAGAVAVGLMITSVSSRKAEAQFAYGPTQAIKPLEPRNEVWGANYPREFERYYQTADTSFQSKHNGNKPIDMLERDPRMVVLWAGYAFAKDYNAPRGHFYAIRDIQKTLRTGAPMSDTAGPQPATCWSCKSPDVPRRMAAIGAEKFYHEKWAAEGKEIVNPIGCADCHDNKTMALQISRPALVEAFARQGKDVSKATHQEKRSLVCAQCHVEYYFRGEGKYLTFPWDSGMTVEAAEKYYDNAEFKDWTHALSRAPMLKAQHPDYEMSQQGIHAQRGVGCADCHMPYRTEGGQKFTDHKIMSPLQNVANSCQVCHREETAEMIRSVEERQDKILQNRDELERQLVRAHLEAKAAWDAAATEEQMKPILRLIRKAQWRWDYAAAGHGSSFHAPVETARIIGQGLTLAQEARISLARLLPKLGVADTIPYPDISTKEKAQTLIGFDSTAVSKAKGAKKEFLEKVVPEWERQAAEREKLY